MDMFSALVMKVVKGNALVTAFVIVGVITWLSYEASKHLTKVAFTAPPSPSSSVWSSPMSAATSPAARKASPTSLSSPASG